MGVHPGVDSGTDGICCGVHGAARRGLGLDAHGARKNPESLDNGLHVVRHDDVGGLDLGFFCADA